ncbi:MAG: hypothetical protein IH609_17700 [Dehalococcoidia bacterium]|nr:hypothetical protein [Dehalococcoidia bacterium]
MARKTFRSTRSRIAAYTLHAKHDSRELTSRARSVFMSRFERLVDPDGQLDPAERTRRAGHAKRAYFINLGAQSGKARRNAA